MRNEVKVLMGATKERSIVFANITTGGDHFAVSFDEVYPVVVTDEYLKERAESLLECLGKDGMYDLCERFDCKPSELLDEFVSQSTNNYGVEEILDISLYSESFTIEGADDDIYFESSGCGQHDTREELVPIDPQFSEWLHTKWDKFHLQNVTPEWFEAINSVVTKYSESLGDEEEWIKNWLTGLVEEGAL